MPGERELACVIFALDNDDARHAVVAWRVLAQAVGVTDVRMVAPGDQVPLPGLHPTRSARLEATFTAKGGRAVTRAIGAVGEIDPQVAAAFGVNETATPGSTARRIGWLEVDLGLLLDTSVVARRVPVGAAVSRFPSSDIDLALVVNDAVSVDDVASTLAATAGELLESVALFDVYRGPGIDTGHRSLAFRLRFCSSDHTLTDDEVGTLRAECIGVLEKQFGARLR